MPLAMTLQINKSDIRTLSRIAESVPGSITRILPRAINRTMTMARTDVRRRVQAEVDIKASIANRELKVSKASGKRLEAGLFATYYRPGLFHYKGTRWSKARGATYRISAGTGKRNLPHGFEAVMASGHRGIFQRARFVGKPGKTMKSDRRKEAIFEKEGISIWHVIKTAKGLLDGAIDQAQTNLSNQINHQITYELRKHG